MMKCTFFRVRSETGKTVGSSISRSLAEVLTIAQAENVCLGTRFFSPLEGLIVIPGRRLAIKVVC